MFLVWLLIHILQIAPMGLPHERQGARVTFERSQQRSSKTQSSPYYWREIEVVLGEEPDGSNVPGHQALLGDRTYPSESPT